MGVTGAAGVALTGMIATASRAGRRAWIGLAVIALPCLVYAMDLTVLNLALPALSADLHPTSTQLLWIIDVYGFVVAGALITMGALGDRIGTRRLLMLGAGGFAAYSSRRAPCSVSLIRAMFQDDGQAPGGSQRWVLGRQTTW